MIAMLLRLDLLFLRNLRHVDSSPGRHQSPRKEVSSWPVVCFLEAAWTRYSRGRLALSHLSMGSQWSDERRELTSELKMLPPRCARRAHGAKCVHRPRYLLAFRERQWILFCALEFSANCSS